MRKFIIGVLILCSSLSFAGISEYATEAIQLMLKEGRDITASRIYLEQISNSHQVEAIKVLLNGKDYLISDKMLFIIKINHELQVKALSLMVNNKQNIKLVLPHLLRFTNTFQLEALDLLLTRKYPVLNKLEEILKITNPMQVKVIDILTSYNRWVMPSLPYLASFNNEYQVNAVEVLAIGNPHRSYNINYKHPYILLFDNPYQVEALKILVEENYTLFPTLALFADINNQAQVDMIRSIAKNGLPMNENFPLIQSMKTPVPKNCEVEMVQ